MAYLTTHPGKTSIDLLYAQISAYEVCEESLERFYKDLKQAQKEAKEEKRTVILDYSGHHTLHIYPTGLIQLMYSGPLYELTE